MLFRSKWMLISISCAGQMQYTTGMLYTEENLARQNLRIKENSFLARIARLVLRAPNVAMVLGRTIHLSGVSRQAFLQHPAWVAHELCHVQQFQSHGFWRFLGLYLWESVKKGYYHNRFEAEARLAGDRHRSPETPAELT